MEYDATTLLRAFGLTLGAGLATGLGAAIAFVANRQNTRLLSIGLSFSAGVMLVVSFVEILPKGAERIAGKLGEPMGGWVAWLAFFIGMAVIAIIDRLVPSQENPHEVRELSELEQLQKKPDPAKLHRLGIVAALAIGIHNFPEGMATFLAGLEDPKIGISIAIAVALHNIPEGVSVAVPIYYATGSRAKAFRLSMLSGLAEPVGAALGFLVLAPFLTPPVAGALFCAVAGVMVFVSLDELLPTARVYAQGHDTVYGMLAGMAVMAASLQLAK